MKLRSKAQGEKITTKVGGNLNIETLQEKEPYEEAPPIEYDLLDQHQYVRG